MFKVQDLRFTYPKNKEETIQGISFDIPKGTIFGFLGPSGAGKSTTQKILVKLLDHYQGEIMYDGKSLKELKDDFYEEIGVCFEMPISFSKLTGLENLQFFANLYKNQVDVEPLLKRMGLWEDRNKLVSEYSKGMKIRLNFIRALINQPKMLFLDEPTNGLDPMNARILKDMIKEFKDAGGTVFITSHIMSDIDELCDEVAFIANGVIVAKDSPRQLKIDHGQKKVIVETRLNAHLEKHVFDFSELSSPRFIELCQSQTIETIHSMETTLEDIFIKVTGVKLHDHD
ncbi:MAG: ABC transporter ATP-binding protein [Erysipelothrix sp.]|nr:ABC transporter ATP-binding protein [Erysipelothrix sp.]